MTDHAPIPAKPGDLIHILAGGLLCFGGAYKRGDVIRLTADDIEGTRDRLGDSWCDDLSDSAQIRRWGEPRFGIGPWPEDLMPWLPGSPEAFEAREEARARAHRLEDPQARAEAVAEVARRFGPAPTSRTLNRAEDPSVRAERAQRVRLDKGGVRSKSNYSPTERA